LKEFILIFILLINILKYLSIQYLFRKFISIKNNIGIKVIIYFLLYQILFTGIFVSIIRIFTNAKISNLYNVTYNELLEVEIVEFISFTIFIVVLSILIKTNIINLKKSYTIERKSFFFLIFINILCFLNYFNSDLENKLLFTEALKFLSGPSAILLLFFSYKLKQHKLIIFFSILHLSIFLFLVLSTGVRGPLVGIILIFLFLSYNFVDLKIFRKNLIILLIPAVFLIFINNEYSKVKTAFASAYISNPDSFQNIGDISLFIIDYFKSNSKDLIQGNDSKIFEEFEFRFGAKSMFSVGFFRFVKNQGYTYFNPIVNTFYVFFPRIYFNEDKPYPDSYNGDINGMGMYVCANEIDGSSNMTDFFPSSHYFWELGFIGVIIFSFISALYIGFILRITKNKDIIFTLLFTFFSLKPYYFIPQFTISDMIIMIVTKISLFLILYTVFNLFYYLFNKNKHKQILIINSENIIHYNI
jgi:hypothetical protein